MHNPIYNITPFTLLDYPDKTACIIWFAGCNMKCPYCYNPEIVLGKGKISFSDSLTFIEKRRNLLDGVVLSGGECTMHHGIEQYATEIKAMKMLVKIDTNGSHPEKLSALIKGNLVDYVALDFKSLSSGFHKVTKSNLFEQFAESLELLITSGIPFEVRTTYHAGLLSSFDIQKMAHFLDKKKYKGNYYIQNFVGNKHTLGDMDYSVPLRSDDLVESDMKIIIRNN